MTVRPFLLAAVALAMTACSSSSPAPASPDAGGAGGNPGNPDSGTVSYGAPTDTYVANLMKPGVQGKYAFTLVQGVPAPPDLDGNVWTVKITDGAGASPSLSQVSVLPFMPQMGHGSDQTPQITANADGSFTVANIYLFMPGLWTITIAVSSLPEATDGGAEAGVAKAPVMIDDAVFTFGIN